jgi:subtilisin-like proprotein convertase family protein
MSDQTLLAAVLAALASAIRCRLSGTLVVLRSDGAAGVRDAASFERLEDRVFLSGEAIEEVLSLDSLESQDVFAYPSVIVSSISPDYLTPPSSALTPSQVRHAYGIDQVMFGSIIGDGTGQTIAIIDAYHYPTAWYDLQQFDLQFGLADPPSFLCVAQDGSINYPPTDPAGPGNGTWSLEAALDIQWSHAIAPQANILLVEATDNSYHNLVEHAVNWARSQPGVVAISMSFGSAEFSGETNYDTYFTTPTGHGGVTFLAATGDTGEPGSYPAYSPNVVAVGGTTLTVSGLDYVSETGWSGSGGGISSYENQPVYQQGVVTQSTTKRTTPDVAMVADPNTGVAVYDSYDYPTSPWVQVGGTSLSTPLWAGLIAIVDQGRALASLGSLDGRTETLPMLYQLPASDFHDITSGNNGYAAGPGYDLVTGLGTPIANKLIYDLVSGGSGIGSIAGTVFEDTNNNLVLDSGDVPLQGVEVYLDANSNGVFDPATSVTASSGTINKAIPDNKSSGVTTTLAFSGIAAPIADVTVTLNITHTRDSDLTVYLIGPDGTQVTLFSMVGGSGDNFTDTTLSDAAAISITAGTAPFTGTFRPSPGPLSAFDGKAASGTWTLKVVDSKRNSTGSIQSWSLTVTTPSEVSVTTGADGRYSFNSLPYGTYTVRQIVPFNEVQTAPDPDGPSGGAYIVAVVGDVTGRNFADFCTLLSVTAVSLNDSKSRSVSTIDPSGAGVQTIQVTFSQTAVFSSASVVLQEVTFPGGVELIGATLTPLGVAGSGTNTMTITLAGMSAIDTWVKVTLKSAATATVLGNPMDGDAPVTGSGLGYIADAALDLPSGDGIPGGDAVFYVGSLRGDFNGDGYVTAADKASFLAAWYAKSLDADFRGVGFGVRPPDGQITLGDIDGFTSVYLAAVALGRHLDLLPTSVGGQSAGVTQPALATSLSPEADILAEAAGQLPAGQQTPLLVAGQQGSSFSQGDEESLDAMRVRRMRPVAMADASGPVVLRV